MENIEIFRTDEGLGTVYEAEYKGAMFYGNTEKSVLDQIKATSQAQ